MANAFIGLIFYEEKHGHIPVSAEGAPAHFLLPASSETETALLPKILSILPGKRKESRGHLEQARELFEEELPEARAFAVALSRAPDRRKRKIIWTPFGKFIISELCNPLSDAGCLAY